MADLTPQYNAIYLDILRYCKCDLLRYIAIKCDILSQNIAKIKSGARQHLFAYTMCPHIVYYANSFGGVIFVYLNDIVGMYDDVHALVRFLT